jgi:hypothetical protein
MNQQQLMDSVSGGKPVTVKNPVIVSDPQPADTTEKDQCENSKN